MPAGYNREERAQYFYKPQKIIKVEFWYYDGRWKEGRLTWINENVLVIKNIDIQKPYYLLISANLKTEITIEDFYYQGVKYDNPIPPYQTPEKRQKVVLDANYEDACKMKFELIPGDVGKASDLTRIRFDEEYIDIFHEQKQDPAAPENPPGQTQPSHSRKENKIFYSWCLENGADIIKEFEFSVLPGETWRGSERPLVMHWLTDNVAVIYNVQVNQSVVFRVQGNYKTTLEFHNFSLETEEYKNEIAPNQRPNDEDDMATLKLGEQGVFWCQVSIMLSSGEYASGKRDLIRIWFDGQYIDFFFSTKHPPSSTLLRSTNCIKCSRALQSS